MKKYLLSDPAFFKLIKQTFAAVVTVVVLLAAVLPAPLQAPANIATVPNPSRAAWFLVWMQELVSYSTSAIYAVIVVGGLFVLLPWLPGIKAAQTARWLPADQRVVNRVVVVVWAIIVILTVVALLCRGGNWAFDCFI